MTTILNARNGSRIARRRPSRTEVEQTRTALELRLLSLTAANAAATVRTLMMSEPAALDWPLSILTWLRESSARLRTLTVQVPLWLTVFAIVAGSYALHQRGTSAPPCRQRRPRQRSSPRAPPAAAASSCP